MSFKKNWLTEDERIEVDGMMAVAAVLEQRMRDLKAGKSGMLLAAIEEAMEKLDKTFYSMEYILEDHCAKDKEMEEQLEKEVAKLNGE